ncbi:MAG: chromosome segregation protein SMC [Bacillota bacterium]
MHLLRLEMQGFKSFINKMSIELDKGITVVVGPNGSGKSNIVDALRFVLGEQSIKSLRGSKLEDIIFSGTKKRRSVGMAEVSIVLDNSTGFFPIEYSELTVTRRIHRDGESQYLINKVPCRLKDVQSLFMDTGLGKGAFAIIGQGKVDEIINSSPEDRRPLFEEVAGITKYKHRKKEAQTKVLDTERNLIRLEDLIYEIQSQLPTLKEEADKAKDYLEKSNVLDNLEYQYYIVEKEKHVKRLQTLEEQTRKHNSRLSAYNSFIFSFDKKLLDLKLTSDGYQEKISPLTAIVGEIKSSVEKYLGEEKVIKERINNLHKEIVWLKAEVDSRNEEIKAYQDKIFMCQEEIFDIEKKKQQINTQTDALNEQLQKDKAWLDKNDEVIRSANNSIIDYQAMVMQYNNDITKLETKSNLFKKQGEKIIAQVEERNAKLAELQKVQVTINNEVHYYKSELERQKKQCNIKQNQLDMVRRDMDIALKQIQELDAKILEIKSKIKVLADLEKDKEGYFPGVKLLLQRKTAGHQDFKGIIGSVADLLDVPSGLVLSVETALGSQLQNIVTYTEQDAQKAIEFLKKEKVGKVTFLPLNTIQRETLELSTRIQSMKGFIGLASELIFTNSECQGMLKFLLGRVVIVENLAHGLALAKAARYAFKVVSLDGQVILPGGPISGGYIKASSSGLIQRKKELTSLKEQLALLEGDLAKKKQGVEKAQVVESEITQQLRELETHQEKTRLSCLKVENVLEVTLEKIVAVQEEIEIFSKEKKILEDQLVEIQNNIVLISQSITELQGREVYASKELNKLLELKSEKQVRIDTITGNLHKLQLDSEYWEQKFIQSREKLVEMQNGLDKFCQLNKTNQEKIKINEREILRLEQEINLINYQIQRLSTKKEVIEDVILTISEERNYFLNKIANNEKILSKANSLYHELVKHQHQIELERAKIESSLDTVQSAMNERFGVDYVCDSFIKVNNIKLEVEKLKAQISSLGQVNLGSIEHYEKLYERVNFLEEQRSDMDRAKRALEKVIKEIDSIMEERFSQTFAKINEHFSAVFRYLFGGGDARLLVTNEEDLLNAGIDIEVQPPGKRLQNLTLLSGGEKALTAIALLFAFLKVKPSPFCFLDEIETSLDEANEQKFSQFLRELSKNTQFLIVTHRQTTMLAADCLYGVTMEEPGVSKIISVKLVDNSLAI